MPLHECLIATTIICEVLQQDRDAAPCPDVINTCHVVSQMLSSPSPSQHNDIAALSSAVVKPTYWPIQLTIRTVHHACY